MKISSLVLILFFFITSSCKKNQEPEPEQLILATVKIGTVYLDQLQTIEEAPIDKNILITFTKSLDTSTVKENIILDKTGAGPILFSYQFNDNNKTIVLTTNEYLENNTVYTLEILSGLKGSENQAFPGIIYSFKTIQGKFVIEQISINGVDFALSKNPQSIDFEDINLEILFSEALNPSDYQAYFSLSGNPPLNYSLSESNKKVTITNVSALNTLRKYYLNISGSLVSENDYVFDGYSNYFYTSLDSTYKFPEITDDELLELIQKQTFKYFWDFGHPASGLARERNSSGDVVTTGGSGFGVMSIIVGIERGFITRSEGLTRLDTILNFLETADRFHGVWPHWINGSTGKVVPFSQKDNGGDLVESSFLVAGLLTFRQYLNSSVPQENALISKINSLWQSVDWDWYRNGENVLHWHWSPNYNFEINFELRGYYEAMITYILAIASPTHSIQSNLYNDAWCRNGGIVNGKQFYGYTLPVGYDYGGPLFFAHYSFLGLDPRNLQDTYANYWEQNVNHSLINWSYCKANPKNFVGYSKDCWGLTASDNQDGYSAHQPTNDLGVISPTAAVSSLPYCPEQSMDAIRHFYYLLGDKLWGPYGFYDAFNITENWWANSYLAIDQGPMIVMIENHRTGLLWDLFMSSPEITGALDNIGIAY